MFKEFHIPRTGDYDDPFDSNPEFDPLWGMEDAVGLIILWANRRKRWAQKRLAKLPRGLDLIQMEVLYQIRWMIVGPGEARDAIRKSDYLEDAEKLEFDRDLQKLSNLITDYDFDAAIRLETDAGHIKFRGTDECPGDDEIVTADDLAKKILDLVHDFLLSDLPARVEAAVLLGKAARNQQSQRRKFSPEQLATELECSLGTVRKYALLAKTRLASRGERTFRYTAQEIKSICHHIQIEPSATARLRLNADRLVTVLSQHFSIETPIQIAVRSHLNHTEST